MNETAAEPSQAAHRDYEGAKIGMWLFLFTEMILFGGLFLLYSAQRSQHAKAFAEAGQEMNQTIGVANTFVLLTSSLTVAMSITALRKDERKRSALLLGSTIVLGGVFLINKAIEWTGEIRHGVYPGSETLEGPGTQMFVSLYFTITGLHGLHVAAGMAVLAIMLVLLLRGRIRQDDFIKLENGGLYWHLVDIVWIFILPLFYLAA